MSAPGARDVARRVLARVDGGAYTTLALAGELSRGRLSDADRALATELSYGALKQRARLDRALAAGAPRGIDRLDERVRDALRLAAYQILFLRVPAHAAVDDAVEEVKRLRGAKLAGFANALLRRLAREGEPPLPPIAGDEPDLVDRIAVAESAPGWLVERALAALAGEARAFLAAMNAPAPTWLRANPLRATRDQLGAALASERPSIVLAPSPLVPEALAARHGGDLSTTRAFAEGWCTAQDLGAQVVARLAAPGPRDRILDACAGVGGKSTHLAALAGDAAEVDAADLSPRKLALAADLAHRLGLTRVRTVAADLTDGAAPLSPAYDLVVLDAPCSGFGVLRRHPEAKWRPPPDLAGLTALQARLLDALAPRVRPGGALVYSVCTFTDEEGPAQVAAFLARSGAFSIEAPPAELASLVGADGALRTWPHRHDADAFYAVRLRRRA